jgi:general secretion pathway protein I
MAACASMRAERGFTLIEIMVALVVFSLAAMALIRLEGATIRSAGVLDRTMLAQIVARNVAIEAVTETQAPATGATRGAEVNGGARWSWTRMITPTVDPRIVRVDVAVADPTGQVLGRLSMVRPPTPTVSVSTS